MSGQGGAQINLTSTSDSPSTQIDVVAIDEEVAFCIECKWSDVAKKAMNFSADLAKHVGFRQRFTSAVATQYPESKRPSVFAFWTCNLILSENDRARAAGERVSLLDESDLEYYEKLVAQIGSAARYQFLADLLQGRQIPGLEITVPAIRTKIGKSITYSFCVSPEYLLKIAFVSHRAKGKASDVNTYQRLMKRTRLNSVRQYISEGGIFPTNIVVNIENSRWLEFSKGKQESEGKATSGWLKVRPSYRVAWIIDGQHRLFAYADHPKAAKSTVSVLAFVGLEPSEQAKLFVDINARQKKVKQNLLQELYAELHWDAAQPQTRVQAVLSKVVVSLDQDLRSPFRERILKADDDRSEHRCISLNSVFKAMDKSGFYIARIRRDAVIDFGPLWRNDNAMMLHRSIEVLIGYFAVIKEEAATLWNLGSAEGGGLAMNDGVTVCINTLRSVFLHLQETKRIRLDDLSDKELVSLIAPWARAVGKYFASMSAEQMTQFRALRGVQGQTTATRRVEEILHKRDASFEPPGLKEFLEREKAQTTTRAFQEINQIETILQRDVIDELKNEFGRDENDWFFAGVPKSSRKRIDDRINEDGGKKGGREANFDFIDYRDVITDNWSLFESRFARGKGSKDSRTKWIVEVNELRKPVMHASKGKSLPITEEQLASLVEIRRWLQESGSAGVAEEPASEEQD